MNVNRSTMLEGLTVLELDDGLAEFAGKLLADSGAEVIKIEPPRGAPGRAVAPFVGSTPDRTSLQFEHYNTSKQSVVLDLTSEADRILLTRLAARADVVLDGLGAGVADSLGVGHTELSAVNPALIYCAVTPFGCDGPWAGFAATDLTQLALGGVMASCGYDDGADYADGTGYSGAPVAPTGGHVKHLVGMMAVMATLAAVLELGTSGRGQFVDVSAHEATAVSTEMAVPFWLYQQREVHRHTARHAMPARTPRWQHRCADGKYLLALPLYIDDARFAALVEWFDSEGMAEDLADEKYRRSMQREDHMFHVVDVIGRFCARHDSDHLFREAQARRLPWAPVNSPDELLADPHFTEHRDTFVSVPAHGGVHLYAQPPFLIGHGTSIRPAPRLGEHTRDVLGAVLEDEYTTDTPARQQV
ncbi:CaiB/BaiF CoA transferase family protein [Pseudonocardia yuanmonensis]